jgi:hypothetical protein
MEVRRWLIAAGVMGMALMIGGCDTAKRDGGGESSMVRGSTSLPSVLLFACDDGKAYETRSRSYGRSACRFSLSLPRDSVCRLWIKREGSVLRHVTFRDYRGNRSPLIYLKDPRIDLGNISVGQHDSLVQIVNDDVMLVASGERPDTFPNPATVLCLGKVDLIYENRKKMQRTSQL